MLQKKGVFNREIVTAFDEGLGPQLATISVKTNISSGYYPPSKRLNPDANDEFWFRSIFDKRHKIWTLVIRVKTLSDPQKPFQLHGPCSVSLVFFFFFSTNIFFHDAGVSTKGEPSCCSFCWTLVCRCGHCLLMRPRREKA